MTQEEKQLLLKDLCARLPYGVKCKIWSGDDEHHAIIEPLKIGGLDAFMCNDSITIKPYLRPMSSMTMTEVEKKEYELLAYHCIVTSVGFVHLESQTLIDWLNKNMFDYRGLIPKELALEAPKDMYNVEE